MQSNPKFSIVIPVYNAEAYLRECLDSVLAQTVGDWEAICVDDGSTDGSNGILKEYAAHDSRFRVLSQANAGPSVARNVGIDAAKGEWVVFLDSDDFYYSNFLQTFYDGIIRSNGSADFLCVDLTRPADSQEFQYEDTGLLSLADAANVEKYDLMDRCFSTTRCIRRALLTRNGIRFPVEIRFSEDVAFLWNVLRFSHNCTLCSGKPYYYRSVPGSLSSKFDSLDAYCKAKEYFKTVLPIMYKRFCLDSKYAEHVKSLSYYVILRKAVIIAYRDNDVSAPSLLHELFADRRFLLRHYVRRFAFRDVLRLCLSVLPMRILEMYYRVVPNRFQFN